MPELIVATYLGGYASVLLFALRERPPGSLLTDFCIAMIIALWPIATLVAISFRAYRTLQLRR